jgi:hypothetical protein
MEAENFRQQERFFQPSPIRRASLLLLLSAPAAVSYYSHIGMEHHPQAWMLGRQRSVKREV